MPRRSSQSMVISAATAVAVTRAGAPQKYATTTMTTPPSISGCSGRSMPFAAKPRRSSQIATTTAIATITMNAVFQKSSDSRIAATRTRAEPIAAGRSRPARPWFFVTGVVVSLMRVPICSDLEQLGLLVLEHLVDRVGVLLGDAVEPLLGAGDVVLADLAVLLELLEALLGGPTQVANGDAAVLGLGPSDLDVLLAALLGQLREVAAQHLAVVGRVDAEVGVADRALDAAHRAHVVRLDQDDPGLGGGERRELLERRGRAVVVDHDLAEHARRRPTGPDRRELLARRLDRLVHLAVGLVEDVVDHRCSFDVELGQPALTSEIGRASACADE